MKLQENFNCTQDLYNNVYGAVRQQMSSSKNRIWSEDVGDIAADIVLQFGERGDNWQVKHIGAYISGVLRFKKFAEQRRLKRLTPLDGNLADGVDYSDENDPLKAILRAEKAVLCSKTVDFIRENLPETSFEMLQLWGDGESYDHIALAIGCDSKKVKNAIHRTRIKIKEWRDKGVLSL